MHFNLRKYGILVLVLMHWVSQAQHVSQLGRFSVDFQRGCVNDTVFITPDNDKANTYYYAPGLIDVLDTFHIYGATGIYEIVQLAQEDLLPKTDSLVFEVMPNDDPRFEIYECGSQTVQVDITDDLYDYYRVYFTGNDSVDYVPGDPFPTFTYPSNNVQVLVEGFYNNSYPNCGSTFQSMVLSNTILPADITSAALTQTCGTLFDVTLTGTVSANIKYQVEIAFNNGGYLTIYEGPIANSLTIRDVNNPGFLDYCLRINTLEACSNTIINGTAFCGTIPASQFEYLSNAYAGYSGDQVAIIFNNQSFQDVLTQNISVASTIDTINSSTTYPSAGNNTYQLIMIDSCETILDSAEVKPPYLSITDRDYEINEISLELDAPINGVTETSRELVFYSEDSTVTEVVNFDQQIRLSANIGSIQKIRARYWYAEISEPVYSNEVTTRFIYRIYVPTAFTPNNDGLNDRLEFFGLENNAAEISIFNRWGQQIHFTDNLSLGWNGFVNDEPAPEGSYTYEIKFTSPDGEELVQVGTFALIKK